MINIKMEMQCLKKMASSDVEQKKKLKHSQTLLLTQKCDMQCCIKLYLYEIMFKLFFFIEKFFDINSNPLIGQY